MTADPGGDGTRDPGGDRSAALDTLVAVTRRLAAADRLQPRSSEPLLHAVVATAATVLDAQASSIALHDPATDQLVFVAAAGPASGDVVGLGIAATAGIAGYAFSTGQQLAIADVAQDPRFDRSVADSTGYVPSSLLATPLIDEQGAVGVLEVLDRRGGGSFDLHDLEVAAVLAHEATVIARAGRAERDAAILLRSSLEAVLGDAAGERDVEALVSATTAALARERDDPAWRLADRIAQLVETDPDRLELASDWLDALIRHAGRSGRSSRSG
jgi:GAF domain-containing protein